MLNRANWPVYPAAGGTPVAGSPAFQGTAPAAAFPGMMPGAAFPGMMPQMPQFGAPATGMPTTLPAGAVGTTLPAPGMPSTLPAPLPPSGTVVPIGGAEESYIENILRMNLGKVATIYMTFENNCEWNAKIFKGVLEAAGRDHIIISDPTTGKRYLLLMVNLDYITFDEPLNYTLPFGTAAGAGLTRS